VTVDIDVKGLLLLLVSMYLLMLGYLYLAQRSFIYFPEHTRPASIPPNFEFINSGYKLRGWVLNKQRGDAVLYFGGNGESLEYNLPLFKQIFPGRAVYLVSYRGYGDSEGVPTEAGIYSDADALYELVQRNHSSVSVIGRSLGSGVATYLAANRPIARLVLVTPFASMESLASQYYPIFPVRLLLQDKYMSLERAKRISARTLFLYAGNDQIVPEPNTRLLIDAFAPDRVNVSKIDGADHNSISDFEEYKVTLQDFFRETD